MRNQVNTDEQQVVVESENSTEHLPHKSQGRSSSSTAFEGWLVRTLIQSVGNPGISIQLWDGRVVSANEGTNLPTIQIRDRSTLWRLVCWPDFEFGEAYVAGRLQTDDDLSDLVSRVFNAWRSRRQHPLLEKLFTWISRPSRSLQGARRNVHHHYDLGNDFFRLWLDRQLLYTCAYFEKEGQSLEEAQIAKMDHICRKLQLRPGDRVIEAGCGWGAFALHMARKYGVQVVACNISSEQITYAREQARLAGLTGQVTFLEDDWRNLKGTCDVFVSVGMLEHIGPEHYRELGKIIQRCLTPQGRGLIHSIGRNQQRPLDAWTTSRIFPGACPPTLAQAMQIFEPCDLTVLDVENLRLHYAVTLRHWRERFEQHAEEVRTMFDEEFVRMWRLYLAASVSAFETGWLQLYQILFTQATNNNVPMTRAFLYESDGATQQELQYRQQRDALNVSSDGSAGVRI